MKKIVLFGNCQFGHLCYLLSNLLPKKEYQNLYFSNNAKTGNQKETTLIINSMKEADLLIYQPLGEDHVDLCQKKIKNVVKSSCICIAMEYVFNSGVYSLCHAPFVVLHQYGKIFGEEFILELAQKKSKDDIIKDYREGAIDFKLKERFNNCILQMEEREARNHTEIKLVDFIKSHYKYEKLFYTHNHPTNALFIEIIQQLIFLTSLPVNLHGFRNLKLKELNDITSPVSSYDVAMHGYHFKPSSDWLKKGKKLISLILQNKNRSSADVVS